MHNLSYRSGLTVRAPETINENTRTLDLVIATETPVDMYDWQRREVVPEVLLAKGCVMPNQVPMLDTHSRWSTGDVLGSVTGKKVVGEQVRGTAIFSQVEEADKAFQKYREGHLTDFSAGYSISDVERVKKGAKVKIDGRTWQGPVNVVTSWTLREVSCVPIGADENAKVRSDRPFDTQRNHETTGDKPMDKEQFEALTKSLETMADGIRTLVESQQPAGGDGDDDIEQIRKDSVRQREVTRSEERQRIKAIGVMCEKLRSSTGINFDDLHDEMVANGTSEADASKRCLDRINTRNPDENFRVQVGREESEKIRDAAVDGLCLRAAVALDKVGDQDTEFQSMSMLEMARTQLRYAGQPVTGDVMQIFRRALTSSDFPNILSDVANKALLEGFEKAEETYSTWVDTSGRVNDFKTLEISRASEAPSLIEVNPDGGEYQYKGMSDKKESVAVVDYGVIVPFTRKAMVNDDLGALSDIREKLGASAARKYGDLCYAVLTGNQTMGDGNSLFDDTNHGNHTDSGGAPDVAAFNVAAKKMAIQTDIAGEQTLNIRPVYILAPYALKGTVDNLLVTTNPIAPGSAASPVTNPWSYMTPVYDARLDTASATAWYFAARRGMTVKLFTLNGNMAPLLETKAGWSVDGMEFKCRVTAAAKAMDWVGLYLNDGA